MAYFKKVHSMRALRESFVHDFQETTYFSPTFCAHCTNLVSLDNTAPFFPQLVAGGLKIQQRPTIEMLAVRLLCNTVACKMYCLNTVALLQGVLSELSEL